MLRVVGFGVTLLGLSVFGVVQTDKVGLRFVSVPLGLLGLFGLLEGLTLRVAVNDATLTRRSACFRKTARLSPATRARHVAGPAPIASSTWLYEVRSDVGSVALPLSWFSATDRGQMIAAIEAACGPARSADRPRPPHRRGGDRDRPAG